MKIFLLALVVAALLVAIGCVVIRGNDNTVDMRREYHGSNKVIETRITP